MLLSVLLRESGVKKTASWIVAEGGERNKYTDEHPPAKSDGRHAGGLRPEWRAVRPHNGYPLRLVVPGWEAIRAVKWLNRIYVVDQPYMAWHESGNNADTVPDGKGLWYPFELGPKSVITRPSGGQKLPGPGIHEITGLAWTGGGAVRRVEVSVDGGRTYKDAELQQPVFGSRTLDFASPGFGRAKRLSSSPAARMNVARNSRPSPRRQKS